MKKKPNLAVSNWNANNVSVLLGTGTGSFAPTTHTGTWLAPFSVAAADFNGDSKIDLVTSNQLSNTVSVLTGSGTGSFATALNFAVGAAPRQVISADFNGDGKPDLASCNRNANTVSILLNCTTVDVQEEDNVSSFSLYPNPSGSILFIELREALQDGSIQLIDMRGSTLQTRHNLQGKRISLQTDELPNGTYFFLLRGNSKETISGKFIIQH